jgi:hypothetical protein
VGILVRIFGPRIMTFVYTIQVIFVNNYEKTGDLSCVSGHQGVLQGTVLEPFLLLFLAFGKDHTDDSLRGQ